MNQVSIQIPLPDDVRERWDKFVYNSGYNKTSLCRLFIEAITDPVRGPQIERIIQNREQAPAEHHHKKASAVKRRGRQHGGRRILNASHAKNINAKSRARQGRKGG